MSERELKQLNRKKRKEYKKQLKSEIFDLDNEVVINESGDAVIECKIGKAETIFNKHDLAQNRTITDEFEKYLLEETEIIPISTNIEIKMYVDSGFTEENAKQVKRAIKNHFSFNITTDVVKMKKNILIAMAMYMLGLISLFLCPVVFNITSSISNIPFYESMLLFTWFFIWEASSLIFFDRTDLKKHRFNMLRLYNAKISFVVYEAKTDSQSGISSTAIPPST